MKRKKWLYPPEQRWKSIPDWYAKLLGGKVLLMLLFLLVGFSQTAYAGWAYVKANNVKVLNKLDQGYIELWIPFCSWEGDDEYLLCDNDNQIPSISVNYRISTENEDKSVTWGNWSGKKKLLQLYSWYNCDSPQERVYARMSNELDNLVSNAEAIDVKLFGKATPELQKAKLDNKRWVKDYNDYWQWNYCHNYNYSDKSEIQPFLNTLIGNCSYTRIRIFIKNPDKVELALSAQLYTDVDDDGQCQRESSAELGNFSADGSVQYNSPVLSEPVFDPENPGKYKVSFTLNNNTPYAVKFNWKDNFATAISGQNYTTTLEVTNGPQNVDAFVYYILDASGSFVMRNDRTIAKGYRWPENFNVVQNPTSKEVELTWEIPALGAATAGDNNGEYVGDAFEVERADNPAFDNATAVAKISFDANEGKAKTFKATDVSILDKPYDNKTFYYRLRRTQSADVWGWRICETKNTTVTTEHRNVQSVSARKQNADADDMSVRIDWKWNSYNNIWSNGSKVVLKRTDVNSGITDEIQLDSELKYDGDDKENPYYIDLLPKACHEYTYTLQVVPGSVSYPTQTPVRVMNSRDGSYSFTHVKFGNLSGFKVSKGYYPGRTSLTWKLDGAADAFIVQRKEYGSNEEPEQLAIVQSSSGGGTFTYDDEKGVAGVIYTYYVYATLQCGGDNMKSETPLMATGFRTPTGNISGTVSFSGSQGVEGAEILLTTDVDIPAKSFKTGGTNPLVVANKDLLKDNGKEFSLQAYVRPNAIISNTQQTILAKEGMFSLYIDTDGKVAFAPAGTSVLKTTEKISIGTFTQVTATYSSDSIALYIDGKQKAIRKAESESSFPVIAGTINEVKMAQGLAGYIDEVRLWSKQLTGKEIARNYSAYINGNETGLLAYYTFNYSINPDNGYTGEFYDTSYKGSKYNANDGVFTAGSGNTLVAEQEYLPTPGQLGYKAYTASDGSYAVEGIPFIGESTSYTLTPSFSGVAHIFEPATKPISVGSNNTNINGIDFIDKSNFTLQGTVLYEGGTYPVEGVQFTIDNVVAMQGGGSVIQSAADGTFSIQVPIGQHVVKAVKAGHNFKNEGRLLNEKGQDINYDKDMPNLKFYDTTTLRYIGRVAGGPLQESYPLGHSLSKNNLGSGVKVELTYTKEEYEMWDGENHADKTLTHFVPEKRLEKGAVPKTNEVGYAGNVISIRVNPETGEFVADVRPEECKIVVTAPGYTMPAVANINFNDKLQADEVSTYEYVDSTNVGGNQWAYDRYSCDVHYNVKGLYIKRQEPIIQVTQLQNDRELAYFGKEKVSLTDADAHTVEVPLWTEEGGYALGKPLFEQGTWYDFKCEVFENYVYKDKDGNPVEDVKSDRVATSNAVIKFAGDMNGEDVDAELAETTDEKGVAYFHLQGGVPDFTQGTVSLGFNFTFDGNTTPIVWQPDGVTQGLTAFGMGQRPMGNSFTTAGPDKVMFVLRDPPGSNSYSYLEKGGSISTASSYNISSIAGSGREIGTSVGVSLQTFVGLGAGVISESEVVNENNLGVNKEESNSGTNSATRTFTVNQRFQTSDDPLYVGANGDLYVGYSTNLVVGRTANITVRTWGQQQLLPGEDEIIYPESTDDLEDEDLVIVKTTGVGLGEQFATLFMYDQLFIEGTLIPNLISDRNRWMTPYAGTATDIKGMSNDAAYFGKIQAQANSSKTPIYVSYLKEDDANYGKSNTDEVFKNAEQPDNAGTFNGPSYRVIFPEMEITNDGDTQLSKEELAEIAKAQTDTILAINQSIARWENQMALNEEAKWQAIQNREKTLLQNYSYHAGSTYEYTESYGHSTERVSEYSINMGNSLSIALGFEAAGAGITTTLSETASTQTGRTDTDGSESTVTQGFVLQEDGDDDYMTVDVLREAGYNKNGQFQTYPDLNDKKQISTMIFYTRAGATSCPYEGEYTARYFEPEKKHVLSQATQQIERPKIAIPEGGSSIIKYVPSGKSAYLPVVFTNESDIQEDGWYTLKILDESNPDGAQLFMDGTAIGAGRPIMIPAGEVLPKTIEIRKGRVMDYNDLKLAVFSQCQWDPSTPTPVISDTLTFSVFYAPSCSEVNIASPGDNWVFNTNMKTEKVDGITKYYMNVVMDNFDPNYDNFHHLGLQYKSSSASDDDWTTLSTFYFDKALYESLSDKNGAQLVEELNNDGTLTYRWYLDGMDQKYDLRAVSYCSINSMLVESHSATRSGLKDMYLPRLFGSAQPANGILTVNDEVKLTFNEPIADGYLTRNNIKVQGVLNGTKTNHSTSLQMKGNSVMETEFDRTWKDKNITLEMWIRPDKLQDAVLCSHGNDKASVQLGITADKHLVVRVGQTELKSAEPVAMSDADFTGTWSHVALKLTAAGQVTASLNFREYISNQQAEAYTGVGHFFVGGDVAKANRFSGCMHDVRVWDKIVPQAVLTNNSTVSLSGNEPNLVTYYPMNEGRGTQLTDKARGANLQTGGNEWALPEGRSAQFNGENQYLMLSSGTTVVITEDMDYTVEFWFRADRTEANKNAVLLSNGTNEGVNADDHFTIGFADGKLTMINGGVTAALDEDYLDGQWHHYAFCANRAIGKGQIVVDGKMKSYFNIDGLGTIGGAYIYVGVQPVEVTGGITEKTRFFKGEIDDLRFWNLYKSESLIEKTFNTGLTGEEKGLLGYYPFEEHRRTEANVEYVGFSLKDTRTPEVPEKPADNARAMLGEIQQPETLEMEEMFGSADVAPVKMQGTISDLSYDYVVNNDELIITLKEDWERIEKTIVTFTVDKVRDKNGNILASPITWSAYINRNQVRWSESKVNLEKEIGEDATFKVNVTNNGGSIQHYVISNMPQWLKVEPASGELNPLEQVEITFTADAGQGIGTYNEVIYLTDEDNVSEALEVNVKVNGIKPEWKVNPGDYKYSMSVFGKIRIAGEYSTDKEDMLAVFLNGACVGVAENSYIEANDLYYVPLTVYSNTTAAEGYQFKIWDASTGTILLAKPESDIVFVNNAVVGSPDVPVIFNSLDLKVQNIPLKKGWNWISFNVKSDDFNDADRLLKDNNWSSADQVKNENGGFLSFSTQHGWTGEEFTGFNNKDMFSIHSSSEQVLSVAGTEVKVAEEPIVIPGITTDKGKEVKRWAYIAYQSQTSLLLKEALGGYEACAGDVIKSQTAFAMYSNTMGWIGNLSYMEPGKGYMLQRNSATDGLLQYPATVPSGTRALSTRSGGSVAEQTESENDYVYHLYGGNMNIVAKVAGADVKEGDKLLAYADGELRGEATAVSLPGMDEMLFFLTLSGNKNVPVNVVLESNGNVIAKAAAVTGYRSHVVEGTPEEPMLIDFASEHGGAVVYPVPFDDCLYIRRNVEQDDEVTVTITDVAGATLVRYEHCNVGAMVNITWHGAADCTPGTYFVCITINGKQEVYKAIKK
ncbi:LamG-like jellyroll fold domain-containing protein [Bacteroides sp.]